jgi:lipopolysaccharide/colanic/teichoic acid biosynthesis glycosyltransferase
MATGFAMNDVNHLGIWGIALPGASIGDLLNRPLDGRADGASETQVVTFHSGLPLVFAGSTPAMKQCHADQSAGVRAKRVVDLLIAGAALVALFPLLVLVGLLVKATSRGPVFFRQQREGLAGLPFEILKFRSMRTDAGDPTGIKQTVDNDPRVTWVGRIIRRTSIDELPQLINVLRGEMSLVGPRPHVPGMMAMGVPYRELVPYYDLRLQVLPGLTGWAQVNGLRGEITSERMARARVDHDLAYIRHRSLWLDARIILRTILNELQGGSGK